MLVHADPFGQEVMEIGHLLITAHILQSLGELDHEIDLGLELAASQEGRRPIAAHGRAVALGLGGKEQAPEKNPVLLVLQQVLQALPPFPDAALAQQAEGDAVRKPDVVVMMELK